MANDGRANDDPSIQSPGLTFEVSISKVFDLVVWFLLIGIAFFNLTSLNPDKHTVGLDKFVLIKLMLTGAAGMIGIYGVLAIPRVFHLLATRPGVWLTGIAMLFSISSLFSVATLTSFASTISLWCILLFTTTALVTIGPLNMVKACIAGIVLFIVASWIAYIAVPSLGVFAEPLAEGQFAIRMSGVTHPNVLGQFAALGAGLILILYHGKELRSRLWLAVVVMCLAALVFSVSRASSLALIVSMLFVYRGSIYQFFGPVQLLLAGILLTGLCLIISMTVDINAVFSDQVLARVSKSGDSEEVTSMTGRTEIWSYAIYRLKERPITGFGPATSKDILKDYSHYTHNLWLNVMFCSGIFGLICLLFLTAGRVLDAFLRPNRIVDFIIVMIFFNGLVENVVFPFIPSAPTILLTIAVLWRVNESITKRESQASS